MNPQIPSLGYALLGLLQAKPASGYDLRKIFASTSMRTYSDSPGAIYPALRRLEKQELVRGTVEEGAGMRRRQVFRLTARGLAELKKWIVRPVTREEMGRGVGEVMLRFAFSEQVAGVEETLALLKSMEAALQAQVAALRVEFEQLKTVAPMSGRLAFECGLRGTEGMLEWSRYAIQTYTKGRKGGSL